MGGYPVDFQNGKLVIRQYFCSDVCPQYGGWHEECFGVNKKKIVSKLVVALLLTPRGVVLLDVLQNNLL